MNFLIRSEEKVSINSEENDRTSFQSVSTQIRFSCVQTMDQDPDQADLASRAILNKEREERIKIRRERIQAKIAARHSGRTDDALDKKSQKEKEKEERLLPRRGLDEVEKSRRRLARFAEDVTNEVTDVRVASDDWETQRRATEEALRIER